MTAPEQPRYPMLRLPEHLSVNYGSLSLIDKWVTLPILAALSLTCLVFFGALAWVGSLFTIAVLMYRLNYGRVIYVIGQQLFVEPWIRWVSGEQVWLAGTNKRRLGGDSTVIDLEVNRLGRIGILHNRATGTDAIVVTGTGSDIAEQDVTVMRQRHEELAQVVRRVAMLPGYRIGVSYVFRIRPADIAGTVDMYDGIIHPEIQADGGQSEVSGDEAIRAANLAKLLSETVDLEAGLPADVTMASVWTIQRESDLAAAARGKRKPADIEPSRLTVSQVAHTVADSLEHFGISDVEVLTPDGLEDYLRTAWDADPAALPDWHVWRSLDSAERQSVPDDSQPSHWPRQEIVRGNNYCQLDGTYHSVIAITGLPRHSWQHFFHLLHSLPLPAFTVSLVGEAVSGSNEGRILDVVIPIWESAMDMGGIRQNPRRRERLQALQEREDRLHASQFSHNYQLLVGVTGSTLWELEEHVTAALRELRLYGCTVQRITGRARQLPAMWSATTGSNLL